MRPIRNMGEQLSEAPFVQPEKWQAPPTPLKNEMVPMKTQDQVY